LLNVIRRLRDELKRRGASGIVGIGRKFRIMDDDGSKSLNMGEFKKAMKESGLDLSDAELRMLFGYFDRDGGGTIDYEEFLNGVRDPMNERRENLARMAFARMDKDGSGSLEPNDIVDRYDASKHPDVISGKKTPDDVFREFLDTFDVGGEKDGLVTMQEWLNYYNNISASIDLDDYFEL
jgi:Ca2+-binding EF-hand superfamily protein